MTVEELIALLQTMPQTSEIRFCDDNGLLLYFDATREPEVDQEWDTVAIHVTEVEP